MAPDHAATPPSHSQLDHPALIWVLPIVAQGLGPYSRHLILHPMLLR
jgi:hypothetical protein